jgi:uncharacterized protein (TIGR02145 family)
MKRFFLIFITASLFTACKKETSSANLNSSGTISDTSNIINQPLNGYGLNVTDIDGNSYKTVYIGKQHWMAENLKVSKYNDGTIIPNVTDGNKWYKLSTGAWIHYDNDLGNNSKYGKLYNWFSVNTTTNGDKNLCPTGWHVPKDSEWSVLTTYLGGDSLAGGKMKEAGISKWKSPNLLATNASLFNGLPGGGKGNEINFRFIDSCGIWWSSTELNLSRARFLGLKYSDGYAFRGHDNKNDGYSVRCIKD